MDFPNTDGYRFFEEKSHKTIPTDTETFSECFVPYCGISNDASDMSTACWQTPFTSLPKMNAYFSPGNGMKSFSITEFSVCSTAMAV